MTNTKDNINLIAKATVQPDEGGQLALEYFLRCYTGPEGEALYGMRIDMRNPSGNLIEREETKALSGSKEDITVLVEAFAEGTVMPCTLHEMVEEWFCKKTKKFVQEKQAV
ncbi:MAG: DUF6514 family protein [Defluviitaleaceae bacterium]|nr:DUF6514 family protein [Defluviitaleaceae bacterium]